MSEICATPAAKATEAVQQQQVAKPAVKPAEAPPQPKSDRVEVSDEAKARLAAEEQALNHAAEQSANRSAGEQHTRTDAKVQELGVG